jgi:hypothetical protein
MQRPGRMLRCLRAPQRGPFRRLTVNRRRTVRLITIALVLALAAVVATVLFMKVGHKNVALTFSRDDLQRDIAAKFPFDQKLLFITVTYSNPEVVLNDGSDRIGIALDASAKLAGDQLVKGRVAGDWKIRYEAAEGAFYFDDPNLTQFDFGGLSPAAQGQIARVAKPLMEEYLRRVPVYRLKESNLRENLARYVLKSVAIKQGRLYVVVGPP